MRIFIRQATLGVLVGCGSFLGVAGCASTPQAPADVETATDCDDLSVTVPHIASLRRTDLERDTENWRQIAARQRAGDFRTRRGYSSTVFAIQVRQDGSVARACVVEGSGVADRDRGWLEALTIARFRQGNATTGRWLRLDLTHPWRP